MYIQDIVNGAWFIANNCLFVFQQIQTKTNDLIEGVFTTFSPNFDLVLDMAHPVSRSDPAHINPETVKRKMIFTAPDIVTIKVANVDLEYATRGKWVQKKTFPYILDRKIILFIDLENCR